ncbi:MAG: hypothetical protein QXX95_07480 [Nitrososphaerales archaeon]
MLSARKMFLFLNLQEIGLTGYTPRILMEPAIQLGGMITIGLLGLGIAWLEMKVLPKEYKTRKLIWAILLFAGISMTST